MKLTTTITSLDKEDLINLFSTATYGSNWLYITTPKGFADDISKEEASCREEIWAEVLLHGRMLYGVDATAEGEVFNDRGRVVEENEEEVEYPFTLDGIIEQLNKAANGTFICPDESTKLFAARAVASFACDSSDFDLTYADALMQIILFNEIIYG